ncbi:MAG: glycosyltransferase family 4 protein [Vulcanimicrobiota bacterium]
MKLAMSAAHGGFGSERVPLGGGAAVFERLIASGVFADTDFHLLGAGPRHYSTGTYHQLAGLERSPSALGMMEYSRFCQEFGDATTRKALALKPDVLLCHDISEGPNVASLASAGIKVVTIFHVDVVDIFSRLYLKSALSPKRLTHYYRTFRSLPWPSLLKLVFEKQQEVCDRGALSIVPSGGAEQLLRDCYPHSNTPIQTIGWGAPALPFVNEQIEEQAHSLRAQHEIPQNHRVLLTLSRLSPEKAQHRLLQAVAFAEKNGRMPADITVVIAGAPAFMEGERHFRRLKELSSQLQTRVVFPGHVGGLEKASWYRTATLFVVNSLHESYGLTTLEAMQQGCPVVAVKSFGTTDTVNSQVGRLVLPGPELEIRLWGTIELMLQSDLEAMGHNAREYTGRHRFQDAASEVRKILDSLS